jgi:hypothetical protein
VINDASLLAIRNYDTKPQIYYTLNLYVNVRYRTDGDESALRGPTRGKCGPPFVTITNKARDPFESGSMEPGGTAMTHRSSDVQTAPSITLQDSAIELMRHSSLAAEPERGPDINTTMSNGVRSRICSATNPALTTTELFVIKLATRRIATAGHPSETRWVKHGDIAAPIFDQPAALQCAGSCCDADPAHAQHIGKKLVRDAKPIGMRPIPCHQQPAGKPLVYLVKSNARGR